METKTTGQQQQQRNAKTLALPALRQRLQRGIVITAQATRAAVVALFLFLFCSSALWGHVVPSLPAADIGVTATSVAAVVFVGAIIPQAETKTAGRRQQ